MPKVKTERFIHQAMTEFELVGSLCLVGIVTGYLEKGFVSEISCTFCYLRAYEGVLELIARYPPVW